MKTDMTYEKPELVEYSYFGKLAATGDGGSPVIPTTDIDPDGGSCHSGFDE